MIKPTVGRVVLFTPTALEDNRFDKSQKLAAMITYVWNNRMVNLVAFSPDGQPRGATSVTLLQDDDVPSELGYYAEWMPYQVGQAAKTEELQRQLDAGN